MSTPPPPSFPSSELQNALSEQAFGITSFAVAETEASESAHEASADVVLLEGHTIRLSLTSRGYQLHGLRGPSGQVYETVEDALQVVSPLYVDAKQKVLMEKLDALAQAQSGPKN